MDMTFLIDILLNFFTDFIDPETNQRVTSISKIAKHYFKAGFFSDIIAGFPFQLFELFGGDQLESSEFLKLAKLPRMWKALKIFRILKIAKLVSKSELVTYIIDLLQVNGAYLRLVKTFTVVFIMVHLMGCLWFFQANLQSDYATTWIQVYGI